MKRTILVLGLVGILLASAFGQSNILRASIPFEFVVSNLTLPAGDYEFRVTGDQFMKITNVGTGATVAMVMPLTRLAAEKMAAGTGKVSFDVREGKHFIEAVWPSEGAGYLLHATKGEHTHEIVSMK
jgi:hypothetical protein